MQKKLTITTDAQVDEGPRRVVGPGSVSRSIEELVRPHVLCPNLEAAYMQMAVDEEREMEALEWAEANAGDAADGAR